MIKWPTRFVGLLIAGLTIRCTTTQSSAQDTSIQLAWASVSPVANAAFYRVHYGSESRSYTGTIDTGNLTTCTVAALLPNQTYYFAVTASDILGNASEYSEELVVDRSPPIISGLDDLVSITTDQSVVRLPDLTAGATVTDDISPPGQIFVTQTPARGTIVGQGDTTVIVEAKDGSGNIARWSLTCRVEQPQGAPPISNDTDNDGQSNVDEYIAGSDADNPQSLFSISLQSTNGIAVIHLEGMDSVSADATNRVAILECCTNLAQNVWRAVRSGSVDELAATPLDAAIPDAARCRFYRMRIVLP